MDRAPTFRVGPDPDAVFKPVVKRPPLTDAGRIARKKFYDRAAWKRCRREKLRRTPYCEACRKKGLAVEARHVHHVIDLADAPKLGLTLSNLQSLCHRCHSRETLRRLREAERVDDG